MVISDLLSETLGLTAKHAPAVESVPCQAFPHRCFGDRKRRFKEQVRDMGDSTNALMKLRPVTFFYKSEYNKGPRTLQYGY
jgi:hypothetical protein